MNDKLPNRIFSTDVGYKILDDKSILLHIPSEKKQELVHILNRALNCWPECPPEWKHLADILMHGAPLVDYYEQEASTKTRYRQQVSKESQSSLVSRPKYPGREQQD